MQMIQKILVNNMKQNISRDNHFVPQVYLRNWGEQNTIMTYELLVPNENVPMWKKKSIEYSAFIENLYVRVDKGNELDDFEKMFRDNYETPVKMSLDKANGDFKLTMDDWKLLIDFTASQIVRTPAFYERLQPILIKAFAKGLEETAEELKHIDKSLIEERKIVQHQDRIALPIKIERTGEMADEEHEYVQISGTVGKSTWLWAIDNSLLKTLKKLHDYKWSILICDESISWPTSDNPVVCINHFSEDRYNFFGVIGRIGNEIIFPISPCRALYLQIGKKHPARIKLNAKESNKVKRVIVENAFRYIYSYDKDDELTKWRPRLVDLEGYQLDKKKIDEWYEQYKIAEGHYYS